MAALVVGICPVMRPTGSVRYLTPSFQTKRLPDGGHSAYLIGLVIRLREGKRSDCDGDRRGSPRQRTRSAASPMWRVRGRRRQIVGWLLRAGRP